MSTQTADSIKSLENFDIAWWEEAQTASMRSIELLRPTIIRKPSAELWFSWNRDSEDDAIEYCMSGPNAWPGAVVVYTTFRDNYHLAPEIVAEIEADKERDPDKFNHVWLGDYRRTLDGAVYAKEIRDLYAAKRVCRVLPVPGMPVDYFFDLGHRDNTSIWGAQLRMGEYRIPIFYQNRGEKIQHYTDWLKAQAHPIGKVWLPHDADQERLVGKSIANSMRDLLPGVTVKVIPRMNKKAIGIEAVRRIFPNCYFDEEGTKDGLKALGRFRYDVDPDTNGYSQNPLHDENSDAADAFAQLALSLNEKSDIKVKSIMMG
jgi:phage terminase large subunit